MHQNRGCLPTDPVKELTSHTLRDYLVRGERDDPTS